MSGRPGSEPSLRRVSVRGLPAIPVQRPEQVQNPYTDFWIPQVTQDGQIYYANTLTGQRSRDLPIEPGECVEDPAGVGPNGTTSLSGMRAGTGAGLGLVLTAPATASHSCAAPHPHAVPSSPPMPQRPSQEGSPSPVPPSSEHVSHISNTLHARTRAKTDASPPPGPCCNRVPGVLFDTLTARSRQKSQSDSRVTHQRSRSDLTVRPLPVPKPPQNSCYNCTPKSSHLKVSPTLSDWSERPLSTSPPPLPPLTESSKPIAQRSLSPSSPELVSELLQRAIQCINAVIIHLRKFGTPLSHNDEEIIDNLISATITSIRDLLYVAGPPFGHLSVRKGDHGNTTHAAQTILVPAQRRTIATLSKFVLSARALLNDGPWHEGDPISHFGLDAEELEQAVVEFVSIAQGVFEEFHGDKGQKHLRGYLSTPHADLGRAGAGAAGTWKGFGWVSIDGNEEAPRRSLDRVTFDQFLAHVARVQKSLRSFADSLRANHEAEVVTGNGKAVIHELSSLLLFLADIHIARHVDIEPVYQDKLVDRAQYSHTVNRALGLVRSFEATAQALYDDCAALFATTQRVRRLEPCESWRGRDEAYDSLEILSSSLNTNLKLTRQNLGNLLTVGEEQTNILERCDKSPIEWRMSQRSLLAVLLADEALNETTNGTDAYTNLASENVTDTNVSPRELGEQSLSPPPLPSEKPVRKMPKFADDEDLGLVRIPQRPDKIRAFFGDEAPSHYLMSLSADTRPWYLRPNYDPAEVLIDPDGTVRGGTVPALVERLTAHEYADPKFSKAFLMMFRSFVTLEELFDLLIDRFWVQPPPDLHADELADWRKFKQYIIRMRVLNTLKSMVQDEDVLEKEELGMLDRIADFASKGEVVGIPAAKQLLVAIKRVERGRDPGKIKLYSSVEPPPAPIVPKRIELLEIDPLELARQLTICESQLYQKIRPLECMQRSKQSKFTRSGPHDGVANFIRRSNRIAQWVTYSILCKDDPRRRATVLKQFVLVADRCRTIQNFSTMSAIVSGLTSAPIHRLKRSWELVSSRTMSQLETCEAIINSYKNYNNFKNALATLPPPCVPFVGVFLTALTHIQDGSKDYLPGNLVNFRKRQKTSEVIQDLQRWQAQPHNFHPLPSVLVYIDESLRQFGDRDVSDVFWQLSMEREPREREEEKLARILHESGFF